VTVFQSDDVSGGKSPHSRRAVFAALSAVAVLCVAIFVLAKFYPEYAVKSAIHRAFPEFDLVSFDYYRVDPGRPYLDASPYDGYKFELRYSRYPALRLAGDYHLSGAKAYASQDAELADTVFNGRKLDDRGLRALAEAWTSAHPGLPIDVGTYTDTSAHAGVRTLNITEAQFRQLSTAVNPSDLYGFQTRADYFWMYRKPNTGQWVSLGSSAQVRERYVK
jgi:hypothetical protein